MKIMAIPISIEPNTFKRVLELSPQHMLDLIDTVGTAAVLNEQLTVASESKIAIALTMLEHANTMLEQCGCKVETKINNPIWDNPAMYKTEMD